jgi:hypothetical protein
VPSAARAIERPESALSSGIAMVPSEGLPIRTTAYRLSDMFKRHHTDPHPDIAGAFREGVGRLERPERRQTEATRLRICLTRTRRGVLLDRLQHDNLSASRGV